MIKVFNTLKGKIEEFKPIDNQLIKVYVCGTTVYDKIHIGNARSAVLNWAYINNKKGNFILRIADTDIERSKKEY